MKTSAWVLLAALLVAGVAAGDVVYLRDGKKTEGKVTKTEDKVTVETADGRKTEYVPGDVVYIAPKAFASASSPASTSAPASGFALIDNPTRPEALAFMLMRKLAATTPGTESFELRKQIDHYIAMAHDKKRFVAADLDAPLSPADYVRRRGVYEQGLKDAATVFSKLKSSRKPDSPKDYFAPGYAKLVQTAPTWADPGLKTFLLGVANLQAGNNQTAYNCFHAGRQEAPRVAAFAQGEALSLVELDRGIEALTSAVDTLKLKPDSPDALALVRKIMEKVPGTEIKNSVYTGAKDLVGQYEDAGAPAAAQKGINWLTPGKVLTGKDESLPDPPMDRLVFRQAVAVPVADNMLLVDGAVVGDALDIFVRIDAKTIVPATVKKLSGAVKVGQFPPLSLLVVTDAKFTPVLLENTELKDKPAILSRVSVYEEMGSILRATAVKVSTIEGGFKASGRLLAGESAGVVISDEGNLIGFLAAKTDVTAEGGGSDSAIDTNAVGALLKAAKGGSTPTKGKRTITPIEAKGTTFLVYGIGSEKFDK